MALPIAGNENTPASGVAMNGYNMMRGESRELGHLDFMRLLVAQLSNQDPLNPQESSDFIAQLAQFSSLEQLINVNDRIDGLALSFAAMASSQVVSFIGKEVVARGDSLRLDFDRPTEINFTLDGNETAAWVEIRDAEGEVVREIPIDDLSSGGHEVVWDGRSMDRGEPLPAGSYTYDVHTLVEDPLSGGQVENIKASGTVTLEAIPEATPLDFELADNAEEVTITIYNELGTPVHIMEMGRMTAGPQEVLWDGRDSDGNYLPDGAYTYSVKAVGFTDGDGDGENDMVGVTTNLRGRVTGVTYENGYPELLLGEQSVTLGDVISVK